MRNLLAVGVVLCLVAVTACSQPDPEACANGRVLVDGFCANLVCAAGERVVDGACAPLECPDGFTLDGENCVSGDTEPPRTSAMPPGGTYGGVVDVILIADEPAVVFYTTDGTPPDRNSESGLSPLTVSLDTTTELRFFSVDGSGNEEGVNVDQYSIDSQGPEDVTGLTTTVNGPPNIDVAWTNPAEFEGILLVRGRAMPFGWMPETGKAYEVGATVAPGVVVLANGTDAAHSDPAPWGDVNNYAAWAYDTSLNYSVNAATSEIIMPVPHQPVTLNVDLGAGTVEFDQPVDFTLGLESEVTSGLDEFTMTLTLTNLMPRPMFNIKAIFSSVSAGTLDTTGMRAYSGDNAMWFGPNAVPSGSSRTATARVTGIPGGTSNLTVELRFASHPLFIGGSSRQSNGVMQFIDVSPGGFVVRTPGFFEGYPNPTPGNLPNADVRRVVLRGDGAMVYAAAANSPIITLFDLETMQEVMSVDLGSSIGTPPIGSVDFALSADGQFIYAALTEGTHRNNGAPRPGTDQGGNQPVVNVVLVKLNAADLTEVSRIPIEPNIDNTTATGTGVMAYQPGVSPDGTRVAVPMDRIQKVALVDTAGTMNLLWSLDVSTVNPPQTRVKAVAVDDGNPKFVYVAGQTAEVIRINSVTQGVTTVNTGWTAGGFTASGMRFGPDGTIYLTRHSNASDGSAVTSIDPSDLSRVNALDGDQAMGVGFQDGLVFALDRSPDRIFVLDAADNLNLLTTLPLDPIAAPQKKTGTITPSPRWNPN